MSDEQKGKEAVVTDKAPTSADIEKQLAKAGPVSGVFESKSGPESVAAAPEAGQEAAAGAGEPQAEKKAGTDQPPVSGEESGTPKVVEEPVPTEAEIAQYGKGIAEKGSPANKAWARLRKEAEAGVKATDEVAALKAKVAELESKGVPATQAKASEQPKSKYTPAQVFTYLQQAKAGKLDNADAVKAACVDLISGFSLDEVLDVVQQAKVGQFGEASEEILALAKNELAEATARQAVTERQIVAEQGKVKDFQVKFNSALDSVVKEHPELSDPNSDLYKYIPVFREKFIAKTDGKGNVVQPGPLFKLLQDPEWPIHVTPLMVAAFNADKLQGSAVEAARLKEQIETNRSPDAGGRPPSGGGPVLKSAEIEKQLAALGNLSKS